MKFTIKAIWLSVFSLLIFVGFSQAFAAGKIEM
jgi:hypothetical protein